MRSWWLAVAIISMLVLDLTVPISVQPHGRRDPFKVIGTVLGELGLDYRFNRSVAYKYFFAGRVVRLNASVLPFLSGLDPGRVFFFSYSRRAGWVNLPIRIYDEAVNLTQYGDGRVDYVVPERMGGATVLEVKLPPSIPEKGVIYDHRGFTPPVVLWAVNMTFRLRDLEVIVTIYVGYSSAYNYRVYSNVYSQGGVKDDFYVWGLGPVEDILKTGVEWGLISMGDEPLLLETYASTPVDVVAVSLPGRQTIATGAPHPQLYGFIGHPVTDHRLRNLWSWSLSHGDAVNATYRILPEKGVDNYYGCSYASITLRFSVAASGHPSGTAVLYLYYSYPTGPEWPPPLPRSGDPERPVPPWILWDRFVVYPHGINVFVVRRSLRLYSPRLSVGILVWDPEERGASWNVEIEDALVEYQVENGVFERMVGSSRGVFAISPVGGGKATVKLMLRRGWAEAFKSTYIPVPRYLALLKGNATYSFSADVWVKREEGGYGGALALTLSIAGSSFTFKPLRADSGEPVHVELKVPLRSVLRYFRSISEVPVYIGLKALGKVDSTSLYAVTINVTSPPLQIPIRVLALDRQALLRGEYFVSPLYRSSKRLPRGLEGMVQAVGVVAAFSADSDTNTPLNAVLSVDYCLMGGTSCYVEADLMGWREVDLFKLDVHNSRAEGSFVLTVGVVGGPGKGLPDAEEGMGVAGILAYVSRSISSLGSGMLRILANMYTAIKQGWSATKVKARVGDHYVNLISKPILSKSVRIPGRLGSLRMYVTVYGGRAVFELTLISDGCVCHVATYRVIR